MIEEKNAHLIRAALFADGTSDYRSPEEPNEGDKVLLRFRTAKNNVDHVYYVDVNRQKKETEMKKASSDSLFDYYEIEITVGSEVQRYYFQVVKNEESVWYNRLGISDDVSDRYAFRITPGFHTPDWTKGAVMYQIFVDRFCRGESDNDVLSCEYVYIGRPVYHVDNWEKNPSTMDVGCFYGGDLQGVWKKLDYLQYLGIEVIYFNPLFVSPSNHKYDTQDYDHIDPHLAKIVKDGGELVSMHATSNLHATKYSYRIAAPENLEASDAFFAQFMEEVHKRGMKVIIDGVFNHCGSFNKWLDRERFYARHGGYKPGAYITKNSPYHTFFKFESEHWPNNKDYECWWGNVTLPKLNYEDSPLLYDYIMHIGRKWVSAPYNADGWRLDVAADLGHESKFNHKFWKDFRRNVKEANPDAIILAEHYGDPSTWLEGDEWDTVMNYDAFMEPLTWFLTGMEKHSDAFAADMYGDGKRFFETMRYNMCKMQTTSVMTSMNQLSNHDHSRFMTRTNQTVGRIGTVGADKANEGIHPEVYREAVLVQMTWPGAPTLYYGDETGVCGWTDPDSRRTYPWGKEDFELIEYHKYLIALHKRLPALRRGSVKPLVAEHQLIVYGRMHERNRCVIAVNNDKNGRTVDIPVWQIGIGDSDVILQCLQSTGKGYNVGRVEYRAENGILKLELPATSAILLSVGSENA